MVMSIVKKIREVCPDGFDAYEFVNEVYNWPLIPEPIEKDGVGIEGDALEWIDVENFFIKELEDDYMVVVCGGDWQEPRKIRIELIDGNLTVVETVLATDHDSEEIEIE